MIAFIAIEQVWSDDDVVELQITTADGRSSFCVKVYAGHANLKSIVAELDRFKDHLYGGIYDMKLGEFGPEYASGAFQARLQFDPDGRGRLFITVHAESDWRPFSKTDVASHATLYLKSEPALLDRFIGDLRRLSLGTQDKVSFECV